MVAKKDILVAIAFFVAAFAPFDHNKCSYRASAFSLAPSSSYYYDNGRIGTTCVLLNSMGGRLHANHAQTINNQYQTNRQGSLVAAASSPQQQQQGDSSTDIDNITALNNYSKRKSLKRKIYLHLWAILTSAFIIANAKVEPFPRYLLYALSRQQWALVHAVCSMLFSGTIILSALIEYLVVFRQEKASVLKFWFLSVPRQLDANIVLPALTGAIVSGVGQAAIDYGRLAKAPKHVVGAFHLLLTFGLWWGVTDVTSQGKATEAVNTLTEVGRSDDDDGSDDETGDDDDVVEIPKVLKMRVVSNAVSCLFVLGMYALMALKPGFRTYNI